MPDTGETLLWAKYVNGGYLVNCWVFNWSSAPFDCLTLPDDQKETIMAVTETRTSGDPDSEFDGIVEGNGVASLFFGSTDTLIVVV